MSYYNYNLDKSDLINSFTKVKQNINDINPYDDTYKSFDSIHTETDNILKKEHLIFIITSTITTFLTIYTLETILK
jgi:hypothetical protein